MRKYVPAEKLLGSSEGSIYKLAILAAKRATQLADGEKPLVDKGEGKFLDCALEEIIQNRIKVKIKK